MILNGDKLIIPTYFADVLNIMDINTNEVTSVRTESRTRWLKTRLNATSTMLRTASRTSRAVTAAIGRCPDGRYELELMNDGVSNSKNCKSMLFSM